ncbi:zinc-ribbon domain-containing protein, partial [Halodesulfovibrio sp. MK-HDV]|uniref:zinc-ribbon domain-containing protein n=1 Tax=Halodesulfovibrio sp. MK-HDV TaxID=2599925 RepID=UPI0015754617
MLITCPECQFARNINASSIPSKAQLATCPRCKTKFRFRILHDEDQVIVESVEERPVAQNVEDELGVAAKPKVTNEASLKKAAGDSMHVETTIDDDYVESEMVAAMQDEIEQLLKAEDAEAHKEAEQRKLSDESNQAEKLNQAEHDKKLHAEKPSFGEKPQQPARNMAESKPAPPSLEVKKQPVP